MAMFSQRQSERSGKITYLEPLEILLGAYVHCMHQGGKFVPQKDG